MSKWEYIYMTDHLQLYLWQKRSSTGFCLWSVLCYSRICFNFWLPKCIMGLFKKFAFSCQAVQGIVPHRRHNDLLKMKCVLLQSAQMGEHSYWRHCCLLESQKSLIPGCSLDNHNCISLLERNCLLHLQLVPASAPRLSERYWSK